MSRVNFGAKPNMYPLPVLIIATYDKDGNPDAMNAAWGVVTDFNEISISMGDHKTTDNLAGLDADVIAANNSILGCHADGEGTGCGKVVCCLVVAHADGDLIEIKQNRRNNHEQSKFWSKTKHVSTSGSDYCNI